MSDQQIKTAIDTSKTNKNILETSYSKDVDAAALARELQQKIIGEVRFDKGSRALYATDSSNYRQVPIGVVLPKTRADILNTLAICRKYGAPVLSRGGGTSLAGQCCNVAVLMDMSKYYNNILNIDAKNQKATVEPGIVLDHLRHPVQQHYGLTFVPDPATHDHCTIGGMLGNDSCGAHSVMAQFRGNGSRVADNVEKLTIATYDGEVMTVGKTTEEELENIIKNGGRKGDIYKKLKAIRDQHADLIRAKFASIPRRVSGFNLPELLPENGFNVAAALVGTEGTCVTILDATLHLIPNAKVKSLLVLGYPDVFEAGSHVVEIMKHEPIALEGIDDLLISYMKKKGLNVDDIQLLPPGNGWLMVEFGGDNKEDSDRQAKALMEELKKSDSPPSMKLYDDPEKEQLLWEVRESGLGATAWVPDEPMTVPGWEDSAVAPEHVGAYLKDLKKLFAKYGYNPSVYGHFGQGCIHCRVQFDLFTEKGLEDYQNFTIEAAHLVAGYGGSISGEHGDGQARADLLYIQYGEELMQVFKEFKEIWDPEWKMNPGKVIDSYGQLSNLRINNHYDPAIQETHFKFPDDSNSFAQATLRCVGVGKCRHSEGGTMCPSYMVTQEEEHSTRGRARMLYEMLQGDVVNGWKDEQVKESLELCLSCKGCKGDCPVNVDMATYKAEFLSHYYEGRLRPRTAYVFGYIHWLSRLASIAPEVANFFSQTPGISSLVKAIAGVEQKRPLPKFAADTYRSWFRRRKKKPVASRQKLILWADTFNNFFKPETLVAATEVLEAAGFEVVIPHQILCCGRPLYDFGMLKTAKKLLRDILDNLRAEIQMGVPVVGLEPSCVAVFRDELCNLFPEDQDAKRLKQQTFTLAEFLEANAPDFHFPKINRKAVMHGHCHHKAIMKTEADNQLLKRLVSTLETPDTGCCGMAGYFGYEKGDHYKVSVKAGERVLLPAVRSADDDTLIVADGFSCREQIEQRSDRKGLHLAQVLQLSLRETTPAGKPEKTCVDARKLPAPAYRKWLYAGAGAVLLGLTAWKLNSAIRSSDSDE